MSAQAEFLLLWDEAQRSMSRNPRMISGLVPVQVTVQENLYAGLYGASVEPTPGSLGHRTPGWLAVLACYVAYRMAEQDGLDRRRLP